MNYNKDIVEAARIAWNTNIVYFSDDPTFYDVEDPAFKLFYETFVRQLFDKETE